MRWLDSTTAVPSAASRVSTRCTWFLPAGSRPLDGSSSTSSRGLVSSAAARPSRWRMPREKPRTRSSATSASPTSLEYLVDTRRAGVAAAKGGKRGEVPPGGQGRVEPRAVHEPGDAVRRGQRASDRRPQDLQAAAVGDGQAQQEAEQRGLPGAVRADHAVDLALRHIQVDTVERDDITEALGDPAARTARETSIDSCFSVLFRVLFRTASGK